MKTKDEGCVNLVLKERVMASIKEILDADCGFEIYIAMKDGDKLIKRLVLDEGDPLRGGGFKARIRQGIENIVRDKYLSEYSQYAAGDDLADEQNRFYVIEQNEDYQPFAYLNTPEAEMTNFRLTDKENADAILFKFSFQREGSIKRFWAYQKILPSSIPNKQKRHFQLIPQSEEHPDVFEELPNQMFIIAQKIDLIVLEKETGINESILGEIITDEIKLMERHFGLETFVRTSAIRAAGAITTVGLIENAAKLQEYVQRPNKRYARKMMQIHKFPVASMTKEELVEKLYTVDRWKDVFEMQGDQIHIRNFTDVENIIDLFIERYTKSEVTGQEYGTEVKNKAQPRTITV